MGSSLRPLSGKLRPAQEQPDSRHDDASSTKSVCSGCHGWRNCEVKLFNLQITFIRRVVTNSQSHGAQKEHIGSWEVFRTSQKALRPNQYFPSAFIEATGNFFIHRYIDLSSASGCLYQCVCSDTIFLCRFLDVRQQSFVKEWKVTTSSIAGTLCGLVKSYCNGNL